MCEQADIETTGSSGLARRQVLAAAGLSLALPAPAGAAYGGAAVLRDRAHGVVRAAMHVHSSFSEGASPNLSLRNRGAHASMEAQAAILESLGFDACFFTDHDHRMNAETGSMHPVPYAAAEDFADPHWPQVGERVGAVISGGASTDSDGLHLYVSADAWAGGQYVWLDCPSPHWTYRGTLAGTRLGVSLVPPGPAGQAELIVATSHRPALAGRPAGGYGIRYVFSARAIERTVTRDGLDAVVIVPVTAGIAQTIAVTPGHDLRAAFPDLSWRADDAGLYALWVGVRAQADKQASAGFLSLTIERGISGADAVRLQADLVERLQPHHPGLSLIQGLEMSYGAHLNWYPDGPVEIVRPAAGQGQTAYLNSLVERARERGGSVSYNHPFGANRRPLLTGAARQARIRAVAQKLLATGVHGAETLEVGYTTRGEMDLDGHLELWDILLAAGLTIYANGASDNHAGTLGSWTAEVNDWVTDILAPGSDPAHLVPAMRAGRAFVSRRGRYDGKLTLYSGATNMGGARPPAARVAVICVEPPANSALRVVQYAVHGRRDRPARQAPLRVTVVPARRLSSGPVQVPIRRVRSYVRTELRAGDGEILAFSNPLLFTR